VAFVLQLDRLSDLGSNVWTLAAATQDAMPQVLTDHIAAVGAWILLYSLECVLIAQNTAAYNSKALDFTEYTRRMVRSSAVSCSTV
jgi:hypothetical protein